MATTCIFKDGWDDDDEDDVSSVDDEADAVVHHPSCPSLPDQSQHSFATWDDDDPISESETEASSSAGAGQRRARAGRVENTARAIVTIVPQQQPPTKSLLWNPPDDEEGEEDNVMGWGDDADLGLDQLDTVDDKLVPVVPLTRKAALPKRDSLATGWNSGADVQDDDDTDDDMRFDDYDLTTRGNTLRDDDDDMKFEEYKPTSRMNSADTDDGMIYDEYKPTVTDIRHNADHPFEADGSNSSRTQLSSNVSKHAHDSIRAEDSFVNAWDDDDHNVEDDLLGTLPATCSLDNRKMLPATTLQQSSSSPPSPLVIELEAYLNQLPRLQSSVNAVLQYEYSTEEKAAELYQYYAERPGLVAYTVERELPRMEYTVVVMADAATRLEQLPNVMVTDKTEIATIIRSLDTTTLLGRCANQSLLADLLQAISGHDLMVRPQYLASAVARTCRFRLDYVNGSVQADATLELSLPTENGRWKVAELDVRVVVGGMMMVHAGTTAPHVAYTVTAIRPTPRDEGTWIMYLQRVADTLTSLDQLEEAHIANDTTIPNLDIRDLFLQQSQNLLIMSSTVVGMKSAWQDMDTVTGISSKFRHIPSFLPDHVIEAAEQQALAPFKEDRPTSILGGLVRSGWSKLANSVALPEEDPSLYQEYWQSSPPSVAPRLYIQTHQRDSDHPMQMPSGGLVPRLAEPDDRPMPPPNAPQGVYAHGQNTGSIVQPNLALRSSALVPIVPHNRERHEPNETLQQQSHGFAIDDGWDDDDDDDLELEASPTGALPLSRDQNGLLPVNVGANQQQQQLGLAKSNDDDVTHPKDDKDDASWAYNPEDDIIPTRSRWANPRPWVREFSV
jgi:hypothetical protein